MSYKKQFINYNGQSYVLARGKVRPSDEYVANEMKPYTAAIAGLNAKAKCLDRKMLLQKNSNSLKVYEKFERKAKICKLHGGKNIVTLKQKPRKNQSQKAVIEERDDEHVSS